MTAIAAIVYTLNATESDPGHPLQPLEGQPQVRHVIERLRQSDRLERIALLATGPEASHDPLAKLAGELEIGFVTASTPRLPQAWVEAAGAVGADHIVPIGVNQPLIDLEILGSLIKEHQRTRADYTITSDFVPPGTAAPVIRTEVCRTLESGSTALSTMEGVMAALQDPAHALQSASVPAPWYLRNINVRLVVETSKDYELLGMLYGKFYQDPDIVPLDDVIYFLSQNPGIAGYNLT
ncbi:hypothetical protein [Nitrospina watsonii]|uniref:Uncharacterized protein n=1 Tax=Nitrospina watsonii TaxID=1323948 RepID=A0ABN8W600_9BACT|nr:hypothetical protein [Nitrospina watsonii]CAI2719066.1 conserved protein of unknown function [Nitrospina watsonii]